MKHAAGVLGHPVEHSISPRLFAFFTKRTGIVLDYRRFDVAPPRLRATLDVLRDLDVLAGCNVTIPHKERAAALADHRSPAVELLGAANVVTFADGAMRADNTDVLGIALTFRRHAIDVRGRDVAVFGAGGAALAVGYVLGEQRARSVTFVNRTPARSRRVARRLQARFGGTAFAAGAVAPGDAALYVNATPLGMAGFPAISVLPAGARPGAVAFDLVYRPAQTAFLSDARQRGLRPVGGLDMLLGQAIATFRIWFGPRAARELETDAAFAALRRSVVRSVT